MAVFANSRISLTFQRRCNWSKRGPNHASINTSETFLHLKMLADNADEEFLYLSQLTPSTPQVASNAEANVDLVPISSRKGRLYLAPASANHAAFTEYSDRIANIVGTNLNKVVLPGKGALRYVGPEKLPEKFARNFSSISRANEIVRERMLMTGAFEMGDNLMQVSRDPEHEDSATLLIAYYLKGISRPEMFKLWDDMAELFTRNLDVSLKGKVHLVLRSDAQSVSPEKTS